VTLGDNNGTDGQTDRQTDRVRRNMRPPPREEGRIKTVKTFRWLLAAPWSNHVDDADSDDDCSDKHNGDDYHRNDNCRVDGRCNIVDTTHTHIHTHGHIGYLAHTEARYWRNRLLATFSSSLSSPIKVKIAFSESVNYIAAVFGDFAAPPGNAALL